MIYIVRHGQTNWNLEGRCQGRIDIDINDKGKSQAEEISKKLSNIKFDKVFSSPLKRAYNTAKIICNNKIEKDERIIERCNGQLEGKLKNEVENNIDFNSKEADKFGIESISDFKKRIYDFFKEVTRDYKGKNILIVTHAGVSIYAKCFFDGEPNDGNYNDYKLKNCEVLEYYN